MLFISLSYKYFFKCFKRKFDGNELKYFLTDASKEICYSFWRFLMSKRATEKQTKIPTHLKEKNSHLCRTSPSHEYAQKTRTDQVKPKCHFHQQFTRPEIAPISFCQKITNSYCKQRKAAQNTFVQKSCL